MEVHYRVRSRRKGAPDRDHDNSQRTVRIVRRKGNQVSEPKKKPFESQKKFQARKRAEEITSGYVHQDLQRKRSKRESYQERCGHCKGGGVIGGGKPCGNCSNGYITRYR